MPSGKRQSRALPHSQDLSISPTLKGQSQNPTKSSFQQDPRKSKYGSFSESERNSLAKRHATDDSANQNVSSPSIKRQNAFNSESSSSSTSSSTPSSSSSQANLFPLVSFSSPYQPVGSENVESQKEETQLLGIGDGILSGLPQESHPSDSQTASTSASLSKLGNSADSHKLRWLFFFPLFLAFTDFQWCGTDAEWALASKGVSFFFSWFLGVNNFLLKEKQKLLAQFLRNQMKDRFGWTFLFLFLQIISSSSLRGAQLHIQQSMLVPPPPEPKDKK